MISMVAFLLFLGLIVFGPRKTIEMAQQVERVLAQVKQATSQFQQLGAEPDPTLQNAELSAKGSSAPRSAV